MNVAPTRKVTAATFGAALSGFIGWLLETQFEVVTHWPTEYVTIIIVFAFGWFIKDTPSGG